MQQGPQRGEAASLVQRAHKWLPTGFWRRVEGPPLAHGESNKLLLSRRTASTEASGQIMAEQPRESVQAAARQGRFFQTRPVDKEGKLAMPPWQSSDPHGTHGWLGHLFLPLHPLHPRNVPGLPYLS